MVVSKRQRAPYSLQQVTQRRTYAYCTFFAVSCAVLLTPSAVEAASATDPAVTTAGSATDPAVITALAADAYVWGLGPEFIERISKYNTIIGAPFNALKYGAVPAAWNNDATNAGDASVLYVSGFVNFDETPELVLTVPPSRNQYYVVAYYDAYANTIGSIGTRTTPSDVMTSYLLVGPKSPYANKQTAKIHGYEYPVMASDTNVNWFLIRVLANTLIDASDATSVPNVVSGVAQKFALNSLQDFEANGHQPVYPASFVLPPPTQQQIDEAAPYQNAPQAAVRFFTQLGNAVATNPIPNRGTGLSGTALIDLPPGWFRSTGPQPSTSFPPTARRRNSIRSRRLASPRRVSACRPTGERCSGMPCRPAMNWGRQILDDFIASAAPGASTNYWGIVNDVVGTYPNNALGYLFRSLGVVEGGVPNIALDAVYPTLVGNPLPFDGNHTYKVTFTVPLLQPDTAGRGNLPADGQRQQWQPERLLVDPASTQPIQRKAPPPSSPKPVC